MQSLHMKVSQLPPPSPLNDAKQPCQWNPDDLQVIEQFFDLKVSAPPYRPNTLQFSCRTLNVSPQVLQDFIQIMRLELMPDLIQGLKWTVQFCMRVPPLGPQIIPIGNHAVLVRSKILFFLQIIQ